MLRLSTSCNVKRVQPCLHGLKPLSGRALPATCGFDQGLCMGPLCSQQAASGSFSPTRQPQATGRPCQAGVSPTDRNEVPSGPSAPCAGPEMRAERSSVEEPPHRPGQGPFQASPCPVTAVLPRVFPPPPPRPGLLPRTLSPANSHSICSQLKASGLRRHAVHTCTYRRGTGHTLTYVHRRCSPPAWP